MKSKKTLLLIHDFFNTIYQKADKLENLLKNENVSYTRGNYTHHYINIDGKESLQNYFIPVFTIENKGDIGFNLDGIFFEIMQKKDNLSTHQIGTILNRFPNVEIYGYDDCLKYFYKTGDSAKNIFYNICTSHETIIQFNLMLPLTDSAKDILQEFNLFVSVIKEIS
ncbi:MAG: DUF3201 domain-containing protein [Alphaproteobacteria bacterium]|nr:DUF3201 domain-containing protein [Alphaproteobacteria bacterium]